MQFHFIADISIFMCYIGCTIAIELSYLIHNTDEDRMVDSLPRQQVKVGVPREEGQLHITFGKGGAREGAGRKGIGLTKKISLTLPEQVWDDLEAACQSKQISRSELIRQIILAHDPAAPARQEEASHEG